jgi:formamidopyrimidine-DNA glycosylase
MPELPDIQAYLDALEPRVLGHALRGVRLSNPFLVRTAEPPLSQSFGRDVVGLERIGKRIVFCLQDELFLVLHLMIAGRLHWKDDANARLPARRGIASFDFDHGSLQLTEAGTQRRASLHCVQGRAALRALDPGGIEVLGSSLKAFGAALTRENHTLKRALTDPHLLSGIGNAYSDEILHRAQLSPVRLSQHLDAAELARLHACCQQVLREWIARLRAEAGSGFPEKVTAFRPDMAVHGRYGKPCPVCATPVQRIVYAKNETNYCPTCQTGGKLLADRALSRLLKKDWPRSLTELEEHMAARRSAAPKPSSD